MAPRHLPKHSPYGQQWLPLPLLLFTFLFFEALALSLFGPFFFSPFQNKCGVTSFASKIPFCKSDRHKMPPFIIFQSACSDLSADKCNLTYQFTHEPSAMRSIKCSLLCSSSQSNLRKLGLLKGNQSELSRPPTTSPIAARCRRPPRRRAQRF